MTVHIYHPEGSARAYAVFSTVAQNGAKYPDDVIVAAKSILRSAAEKINGADYFKSPNPRTSVLEYTAKVPMSEGEFPAFAKKIKEGFGSDPKTRNIGVTIESDKPRVASASPTSAEMKSEGLKSKALSLLHSALKTIGWEK